MTGQVSVNLLTFNSYTYLPECLGALSRQTYPDVKVTIIDNASTDGTVEWLAHHHPELRVISSATNLGYCGGHNLGIRETGGDLVLLLNPDVLLEPPYIALLTEALARDERVGSAMGKLLTLDSRGTAEPVIDSAGVCVCKNRRTLDRGQGERDRGQYDHVTDCFGPSGAAALYRRTMLEDVAVDGEYFDEAFFAYREEVDLAWRSRVLGWTCAFEARAVGYHDRTYTPRSRAQMPRAVREHMTKNRYLLLLKNDSFRNVLRHVPHILWFELLFWGHAAAFEPYLFRSIGRVWRLAPLMRRKRQATLQRRTLSDADMRRWFV